MLIYGNFPPMSEHSFDTWRVSSSGGVGVESLVVTATNVDAGTCTLGQQTLYWRQSERRRKAIGTSATTIRPADQTRHTLEPKVCSARTLHLRRQKDTCLRQESTSAARTAVARELTI